MSRRKKGAANPVDELVAELALAGRLGRASILFVVAAHEAVRERAAAELEGKLRADGLAVVTLDAADVPEGDIPLALAEAANRETTVFMVVHLTRGGEPALRALNFRREYFTELGARVVFWLTPPEEASLARHATDFWAFRHRTVYLEYK